MTGVPKLDFGKVAGLHPSEQRIVSELEVSECTCTCTVERICQHEQARASQFEQLAHSLRSETDARIARATGGASARHRPKSQALDKSAFALESARLRKKSRYSDDDDDDASSIASSIPMPVEKHNKRTKPKSKGPPLASLDPLQLSARAKEEPKKKVLCKCMQAL